MSFSMHLVFTLLLIIICPSLYSLATILHHGATLACCNITWPNTWPSLIHHHAPRTISYFPYAQDFSQTSLSSFLPPFLPSPPSHTKCTLCHGVIAIRNSHAAHPNWNDNSTDHLFTHGHPGLTRFRGDQPARARSPPTSPGFSCSLHPCP